MVGSVERAHFAYERIQYARPPRHCCAVSREVAQNFFTPFPDERLLDIKHNFVKGCAGSPEFIAATYRSVLIGSYSSSADEPDPLHIDLRLFINLVHLGSVALPAAIVGVYQPGLAGRIYVSLEAAEHSNVTAKILGPDVETMSSATFSETNTICKDESLIGGDVTYEFGLDKAKYIGVTRLEGILADEVDP